MRELYEMEMRFTLSFEGTNPQTLLSKVADIHTRIYNAKQSGDGWAANLKPDTGTCNPCVASRIHTPADPQHTLAADQTFTLTIEGTLVYPGYTNHDLRFDHKQELADLADRICAELGLTAGSIVFDTKVMDPMITFV